MDGPTIVSGVEIYGPAGCGLPVVEGETPATAVPAAVPPPPEFAPGPPTILPPLQPHPDYPQSYPPIAPASSRPTETGPKKVFYQKQNSGQILTTAPTGDMQANEFATNGEWGVVDWAQRANSAASVSWDGVQNRPSHLGTYWWVGNGPPPASIPGALPGDLYLDSLTGEVYQLT